PVRKKLVACEVTVYRQLDESEDLHVVRDAHAYARTEVGHRAARRDGVSKYSLIRALVGDVELQLRHDRGVLFVAHAEAHGEQIAGAVVLTWLVEFVPQRGLKLAVDKGVEVLAYRLVVVRTDNEVGRAGACLQAGVEEVAWRRDPRIGPRVEGNRATSHRAGTSGVGPAIVSGGQYQPELKAEVVRGQETLIAGDESDVPQAVNACTAYLVGSKRVHRRAVGGVAAVDVRLQQVETPIPVGPVAHARGEVAVNGLLL